MSKIVIFMYLCSSLFVSAQPIPTESVQSLVKQVKAAKPSNKRILMNRLKIKLRESNQAHRMQVMQELKRSFSHGNAMHLGQQKGKHKGAAGRCSKHQPKHQRRKDGKGKGKHKGTKHNGSHQR